MSKIIFLCLFQHCLTCATAEMCFGIFCCDFFILNEKEYWHVPLSNLLFSLETFTSFHTYQCLQGTAPETWALSWHLTNMRGRGGITTRVWNRKSRCACNCQFGWVTDRQISKRYSCPSSYTIIFFSLSVINLDYYGQLPITGSKSQPAGCWRLVVPTRFVSSIVSARNFIRFVSQAASLHPSLSATCSARYLHTAAVLSINQVRAGTAPCLTLTSAPSEVIMKTHFITARQEYE